MFLLHTIIASVSIWGFKEKKQVSSFVFLDISLDWELPFPLRS